MTLCYSSRPVSTLLGNADDEMDVRYGKFSPLTRLGKWSSHASSSPWLQVATIETDTQFSLLEWVINVDSCVRYEVCTFAVLYHDQPTVHGH